MGSHLQKRHAFQQQRGTYVNCELWLQHADSRLQKANQAGSKWIQQTTC